MTQHYVRHDEAIDRLAAATRRYRDWRAGWAEWVKDQRERQKTRLVHDVEDALLRAQDAGASVRKMAEVFGTTERRTILRMVERARQREEGGMMQGEVRIG